MSWRTTVVLLVILLLLGGYVIYQNQQETIFDDAPAGTPLPPTPERVQLVNATVDDVRGLGVTRLEDDVQALFLRQEDGSWVQTVPTNTAVISQTMNSQVIGLVNLRSTRTLPADANPLSAYGLEDPAYRISAAVARSEDTTVRITLLIGRQTPAGDAYYVQRQGDPRVYVAPVGVIENLIDLIDNPPLPEEPDGEE